MPNTQIFKVTWETNEAATSAVEACMQAMRRLYSGSPSKTSTVFYSAPVDDDNEPIGPLLMVDFGEVNTKKMSDRDLGKSMVVFMKTSAGSELDDWIRISPPVGSEDQKDLTK